MRLAILAGLVAASLAGLSVSALADGDAAAGERVFKRMCSGCHTVKPDGHSAAGPNLFGIFRAAAGQKDGARYSDAHANSGLVFDDAGLDRYLSDPKGTVPGTKKASRGVKNDKQRADVIAYLMTLTEE